MTLRITVSLRDSVVGTYAFEKDRVTLGRAQCCDVVLDNLALSRTHAEIVFERGEWVLKDLGSRNGVWVHGARKPVHAIQNGDVLGLGKFSLTVTYDADAPVVTPRVDDPYAALGGNDRLVSRNYAPPVAAAPARPTRAMARPRGDSGRNAVIVRSPTAAPRPQPQVAIDDGWRHPAALGGAHIVVKRGEPMGVFSLERDVFTVGGHKSCELRLGSTLAPRRLAMIVRGMGGYSLVNVSSRAEGVWRNGKPVADRCWLEDGDRLEFDDVLVRFSTGAVRAS